MREITIGLPDSLDLMVVCLEAGLGLNATIARVGEERSQLIDALGEEFSFVSLELREGRSREDALRALGDRNGVEDLKSLAGLIIQSDRLGASMAKTLRSHADVLRTKRRQRAEEARAQMAGMLEQMEVHQAEELFQDDLLARRKEKKAKPKRPSERLVYGIVVRARGHHYDVETTAESEPDSAARLRTCEVRGRLLLERGRDTLVAVGDRVWIVPEGDRRESADVVRP